MITENGERRHITMRSHIPSKQLRSFGLIVGGIFAVIGIWPFIFRNEDPRWWAAVLAGALVVPAIAFPNSLLWPYKGWMTIGEILGWLNTRIILGIVFYGIVTPIGAVRRWLGKDPMGQRLRPDLDTYRITRETRPAAHLTKQF